jgi:hypothetical protein
MYMQSNLLQNVARATLFVALFATGVGPAVAWTGPSTAPPNGNTSAPINVSATAQTKNGSFGINNGLFTVVGQAANWAEEINWPPSTGYGILVGTYASGYSEFENAQGYYTILDNGSYGVQTNGYVLGANTFGGMYGINNNGGGCEEANPWTGGCGCPGWAPYVASAAYVPGLNNYWIVTNYCY